MTQVEAAGKGVDGLAPRQTRHLCISTSRGEGEMCGQSSVRAGVERRVPLEGTSEASRVLEAIRGVRERKAYLGRRIWDACGKWTRASRPIVQHKSFVLP